MAYLRYLKRYEKKLKTKIVCKIRLFDRVISKFNLKNKTNAN